jgi:hypothetical protein
MQKLGRNILLGDFKGISHSNPMIVEALER